MTSLVNAALMRLPVRAERNDVATLTATFVDAGPLFTLLSSSNHQILYGRRGTGKTHALNYLAEYVRSRGDHAVYLDLRRLGSTGGLYEDSSVSPQERATRLLVDVLREITNGIYQEVLAIESRFPDALEPALLALEQLQDVASKIRISGSLVHEVQMSVQDWPKSPVESRIDSPLVASSQLQTQDDATQPSVTFKRTESGQERHVVHFGSTAQAFVKIIGALPGKRLWLLLDEWSVVPLELQPLLADFVRRCLLPINDVVVKIAAIEQRSKFRNKGQAGDYVGIELGADMSADLDFDDFMVFNNDAEKAKIFFAELFYRHVKQFIDEQPEGTAQAIVSSSDFQSKVFTQRNAFEELVRSAEGVPRDAINIASLAAQRAVDELISVPHIRVAARKWYQRDKESAVQAAPEALRLLHWIYEEVIGTRRARAFLIRQDIGRSNALMRTLFDARVLHVIKRGVSGRDLPGVRFDAYSLDYGCYVELVSTKSAPSGLLATDGDLAAEVPADDYRAIRRAILDLDKFESNDIPGPGIPR
ncbi:MAG TPA: hypothetical protein VFS43_41260 [Polyangiaceae bacterium]|nr:hypothetical protein [Polyangiaceae bacterium]